MRKRYLGQPREPAIVVLSAPGIDEHRPCRAPERDAPPSLVHQTVMHAAEEHAVAEVRGSAVGPVLNVMCVGEAKSASGESAPPIADLQSAAERRGNGAGSTTHVEERAIRGMVSVNHAAVAGKAPGRFR